MKSMKKPEGANDASAVEAYLANVTEPAQTTLRKMRAMIKAAARRPSS